MSKHKQPAFTRIPLGIQYFIWISLSTAAVLMLMATQNYRSTSRALEAEYVSHATSLTEKNNQLLDSHYDAVVALLLQYSVQAAEYIALPDIERMMTLSAMESTNATLISRIYLITPENEIITAKQGHYQVLGNEQMLNVAMHARTSDSAITISAPYYSLLSGNTVAVAYPFRMRTGQGVVVLEINLEGLKGTTDPYVTGDSQSYIIMTRNNNVVFFGQSANLLPTVRYSAYPQITPEFMAVVTNADAPVSDIDYAGRRYICVQSGYNRFGWRTLALIDEQLFFQSRTQMLTSYMQLMALFSLVLMVNAWMLGRRFAAPIRKLATRVNAIKDIEHGEVILTTQRHDVIGVLEKSYNNLFDRIRKLVASIKESEQQKQQYAFGMLQHQIGPHFLYNTLLCIGNLARHGRYDQVDETLRSLAALLGYCMGVPNELVTLEMELQMVEKYVLIQNSRFGGAFAMTIDSDDAARACPMPKLILQPLVENAITHGLAPKNALFGTPSGCQLTVSAHVKDDKLHIRVFDNGMGMSKEHLDRLREQIAESKQIGESEHIGLPNVARRIRIYFGDSATFSINSETGLSTAVDITLPAEGKHLDTDL